jgi:hypothetical protein
MRYNATQCRVRRWSLMALVQSNRELREGLRGGRYEFCVLLDSTLLSAERCLFAYRVRFRRHVRYREFPGPHEIVRGPGRQSQQGLSRWPVTSKVLAHDSLVLVAPLNALRSVSFGSGSLAATCTAAILKLRKSSSVGCTNASREGRRASSLDWAFQDITPASH